MLSNSRQENLNCNLWEKLEDQEIWSRFQQGDWQAFEYIYRTYTEVLFNYGMKICGNGSLVEDSIQELFVTLWNSRTNLSSVKKIKFYLFTSLKWKITYYLKRERKMYGAQALEDVVEEEVVLPFESKLLNSQLCEERKVCLLKAMNKLPQRQKEILQLLFFENFSHKEVAKLMNLRVRTVYVTAYRALSALKEQLKPYAMKLFVHFATLCLLLARIQLIH